MDSFEAGLEKILGAGNNVLTKMIAKTLYSRLGFNFIGRTGYRLSDYVKEARVKQQTAG